MFGFTVCSEEGSDVNVKDIEAVAFVFLQGLFERFGFCQHL